MKKLIGKLSLLLSAAFMVGVSIASVADSVQNAPQSNIPQTPAPQVVTPQAPTTSSPESVPSVGTVVAQQIADIKNAPNSAQSQNSVSNRTVITSKGITPTAPEKLQVKDNSTSPVVKSSSDAFTINGQAQANTLATMGAQQFGTSFSVDPQTGLLSGNYELGSIASDWGLGPKLDLTLHYGSNPDIYLGSLQQDDGHSSQNALPMPTNMWSLDIPYMITNDSNDSWDRGGMLYFNGNSYSISVAEGNILSKATSPTDISFIYDKSEGVDFRAVYNGDGTVTLISKDGTSYWLSQMDDEEIKIGKEFKLVRITAPNGKSLYFNYDKNDHSYDEADFTCLSSISDDNGVLAFFVYNWSVEGGPYLHDKYGGANAPLNTVSVYTLDTNFQGKPVSNATPTDGNYDNVANITFTGIGVSEDIQEGIYGNEQQVVYFPTVSSISNPVEGTTVNFGYQVQSYDGGDSTGGYAASTLTSITYPTGENVNFGYNVISGYNMSGWGDICNAAVSSVTINGGSDYTTQSQANFGIGRGFIFDPNNESEAANYMVFTPSKENSNITATVTDPAYDPYIEWTATMNWYYTTSQIMVPGINSAPITTTNYYDWLGNLYYQAVGNGLSTGITDPSTANYGGVSNISSTLYNYNEGPGSFSNAPIYYDEPISIVKYSSSPYRSNPTYNIKSPVDGVNVGFKYKGSQSYNTTTGNPETATSPNGLVTTYTFENNHAGFSNLVTDISEGGGNKNPNDLMDSSYNYSTYTNTVNGQNYTTDYLTSTSKKIGTQVSSWLGGYDPVYTIQSSGSSAVQLYSSSTDNWATTGTPSSSTVISGNGTPSDVSAYSTLTDYSINSNNILVETSSVSGSSSISGSANLAGPTTLYDYEGNVSSITDVLGNVVSYVYDAEGRILTSTFTPVGKPAQVTQCIYSETPNYQAPSGITLQSYQTGEEAIEATGYREYDIYDSLGNLVQVWNSNDGVTWTKLSSFTYAGPGSPMMSSTTYTKDTPSGLTTHYAYDELGRLIATQDTFGQITGVIYDDANNAEVSYSLAKDLSFRGPITLTLMDVDNQPTDVYTYSSVAMNGVGGTLPYTGLSKAITDAYAGISSSNFDSLYSNFKSQGELATVVTTAPATTGWISHEQNTMDLYQRLTKKTLSYYLDSTSGLQTATTTFTFPTKNNDELTTITTYANGAVESITRNVLGDIESDTLTPPKGTAFTVGTLVHNGIGDVIQSKDSSSVHTTYYTRNSLGQLTQVTNPDGSFVKYGYTLDGLENLVQDGNGNTLNTLGYDNFDRVVSGSSTTYDGTILTGSTQDSYTYNVNDSLATQTETTGKWSTTLTYYRDLYGTLYAKSDSLGNLYTSYGFQNGRLSTMTVSKGVVSGGSVIANSLYTYDNTTSLLDTIQSSNSSQVNATNGSFTETFKYDNWEKMIDDMTSFGAYGFTFSELGYTYDAIGELTQKQKTGLLMVGGVQTENTQNYSYFPTTRTLQKVTYTQNSGVDGPKDSLGNALSEQDYTYDSFGDILTQTDKTTVNPTGYTLTYTYGNSSNPFQLTALSSGSTTPSFTAITYNAENNIVNDWNGNTFTYNPLGEVTDIKNISSGGVTTYVYTTLGEQSVSGNTTNLYEGGAVADRVEKSGSYSTYIDGGFHIEPLYTTLTYMPMGYYNSTQVTTGAEPSQSISPNPQTSTVYQQNEDNGNIYYSLQLNSFNENSVPFYVNFYTPYGAVTSYTVGSGTSGVSNVDKKGFLGESQDSATPYTFLGDGYRAYDPVVGRFLQYDDASPFGAGGVNGYAYCSGDPVNLSDPSGESWAGFKAFGDGFVNGLVNSLTCGGDYNVMGGVHKGAAGSIGVGAGTFMGAVVPALVTGGATCAMKSVVAAAASSTVAEQAAEEDMDYVGIDMPFARNRTHNGRPVGYSRSNASTSSSSSNSSESSQSGEASNGEASGQNEGGGGASESFYSARSRSDSMVTADDGANSAPAPVVAPPQAVPAAAPPYVYEFPAGELRMVQYFDYGANLKDLSLKDLAQRAASGANESLEEQGYGRLGNIELKLKLSGTDKAGVRYGTYTGSVKLKLAFGQGPTIKLAGSFMVDNENLMTLSASQERVAAITAKAKSYSLLKNAIKSYSPGEMASDNVDYMASKHFQGQFVLPDVPGYMDFFMKF